MGCQQCQKRKAELFETGQQANEVYEVGNPARREMGHEMYFASDGRTALCIAKKRDDDEWGEGSGTELLERGPR